MLLKMMTKASLDTIKLRGNDNLHLHIPAVWERTKSFPPVNKKTEFLIYKLAHLDSKTPWMISSVGRACDC